MITRLFPYSDWTIAFGVVFSQWCEHFRGISKRFWVIQPVLSVTHIRHAFDISMFALRNKKQNKK